MQKKYFSIIWCSSCQIPDDIPSFAISKLADRKLFGLPCEGYHTWSFVKSPGRVGAAYQLNSLKKMSFLISYACDFLVFEINLKKIDQHFHLLEIAFSLLKFSFLEQFLEFDFLWYHFQISFGIGFCSVEDHIAFKTKEFTFPALPLWSFPLFLYHPMVLMLKDFKVCDWDENLGYNF